MRDGINVLFYLPCLGLGGIERVVQNLAANLPESYSIYIDGQIELPGHLLSKVKLPDNVKLLTGLNLSYESDRYIPLFACHLYKKISTYHPHIIFSFWHRANLTTGIALSAFRKHNRPKWVFSVHGESPGYENNGISNSIKGILLKYFASKANKHVTITKKLVDRCNAYYHGCNFDLMYNPAVSKELSILATEYVDDACFCENNKTILSIGRLDAMKDYKTLIRAFKIVSDSEKDAKLVILGEGPQRYELQSLIDSLELAGRISLPGFKDNPYKYISRCRIFVLSSSHGEASPMVLSEAMFLSKPIVTTNFFTASDIISDNNNGLIARIGDPRDLGEKLLSLLTDCNKSIELGACAKHVAIERYYTNNSVKKYSELIENLVDHC